MLNYKSRCTREFFPHWIYLIAQYVWRCRHIYFIILLMIIHLLIDHSLELNVLLIKSVKFPRSPSIESTLGEWCTRDWWKSKTNINHYFVYIHSISHNVYAFAFDFLLYTSLNIVHNPFRYDFYYPVYICVYVINNCFQCHRHSGDNTPHRTQWSSYLMKHIDMSEWNNHDLSSSWISSEFPRGR